jgi:hypothetical protein
MVANPIAPPVLSLGTIPSKYKWVVLLDFALGASAEVLTTTTGRQPERRGEVGFDDVFPTSANRRGGDC